METTEQKKICIDCKKRLDIMMFNARHNQYSEYICRRCKVCDKKHRSSYINRKSPTEKTRKKISDSLKLAYKNGLKVCGAYSKDVEPWNKNLKNVQVSYLKNHTMDEMFGLEKSKKIRNSISRSVVANYLKHDFRKKFKYDDNYFRSNWECKVAKWLDDNEIIWEYESKDCMIKLSSGKYYLIDFYLPSLNIYIEVKGYWDDKSKFKFIDASKKIDIRIVDSRNIDNISLEETSLW